MERIAQTNIQLYNQLRERGLTLDELALVHRAYEFSASIYSGYYQADGKPFASHCVGVASILAHLDRSAAIVAAGLVHNVYGNGDFGDGRHYAVTDARRRLAREALGSEVEGLIYRFHRRFRDEWPTLADLRARLDGMDAIDRDLVLIELADGLEKYVDGGVGYYGDGDWGDEGVALHTDQMKDIAGRLGQPQLVEMIAALIEDAPAADTAVLAALRPSDGRKYLELSVPRSCRRRIEVMLRPIVRKLLMRYQPKTRVLRGMRQLSAALGTKLQRLKTVLSRAT